MSAEDIIGKTDFELFPSEYAKQYFEDEQALMASGKPLINREEPIVDKRTGELHLNLSSKIPWKNIAGQVIGLIGINHDITERKKAELELIKSEKRAAELGIVNKELEQFSYLASHDLQEPLRTVTNYMKVFEEDCSESMDDTARKYLHSVKTTTERMRVLIKSLLDFSLLGRNSSAVCVDCEKLIDVVIADLDDEIKTSGAIIEVSEMPKLNLYDVEMRKLFRNLIMNAIKFQQKGNRPEIQIRAEEINNAWKFSIRDNGIGIAPKHFERVFEIFQRLNPDEEYEGTGIGLANCKKIVQLHQGEIWLESTLGQGSVFYFTLQNLTL
jgi:PAS domain S-box-containing protein